MQTFSAKIRSDLEVLELARTPQQEEEGNWAEIGIDKGSNFV
jgi:hypothetical protein